MSLHLTARVAARGLDVYLTVAAGETVALMGPNGAGKSTVLALAAGLLMPDDGQVELAGRTLTRRGPGRGPRVDVRPHDRNVALLAQEPLLFPHLSALDNVAFGPRSVGRSRRASRAMGRQWLDEVGVSELAGRRPGQLSGGQAQRVAVARALAVQPQLLLLDEPMAALDVDVTPDLRRTLRRVLAERTVVLVTHDVLDALLLADRIVVLEDGRVVEDRATEEVLARPRSAFAGRLAGVNLLEGTWAGDHVQLADGRAVQGQVTGTAPQSGDRVAAAFRPAAVAVYREAAAGSPRNSFAVRVDHVQPVGDLLRVAGGGLSADITARAVADLDLAPGSEVTFTVKAAEVSVYPL